MAPTPAEDRRPGPDGPPIVHVAPVDVEATGVSGRAGGRRRAWSARSVHAVDGPVTRVGSPRRTRWPASRPTGVSWSRRWPPARWRSWRRRSGWSCGRRSWPGRGGGLTVARQPEGPPPPPVVQRVRVRYAEARPVALRLAPGLHPGASSGRCAVPACRWRTRPGSPRTPRSRTPGRRRPPGSPARPNTWSWGWLPSWTSSAAGGAGRLPADGLDLLECVEVRPGTGALPDRIDASAWRIELPGVTPAELAAALATFLAADRGGGRAADKTGRRELDARAPVVSASASAAPDDDGCAILDVVVRLVTPAVRPDDVLAALRAVAGLAPSRPATGDPVDAGSA